MKKCKICDTEFDSPDEICESCKDKLTESTLVCLTQGADHYEAESIVRLLKSHDIIAFHKSESLGDYLQIYQGFSFDNYNVYVLDTDLDRAKSILSDYYDKADDNKDHKSEEQAHAQNKKGQDQHEEKTIDYAKRRRYAARIIVGIILVTTILAGLINVLLKL